MPKSEPPAHVRNFIPPHCPHRRCAAHHLARGQFFHFHRRGYQKIGRKPGWVRIFQCRHCGRYFRNSCFLQQPCRRALPGSSAIFSDHYQRLAVGVEPG